MPYILYQMCGIIYFMSKYIIRLLLDLSGG